MALPKFHTIEDLFDSPRANSACWPSAPLAAVASTAGLPVAGVGIAVLVGVTVLAALAAPAFRSIDDLGSEEKDAAPGASVES